MPQTPWKVAFVHQHNDGAVSLRMENGQCDIVAHFPAEETVWLLQEDSCGVLVAAERGWSATVDPELCSDVALAFGLHAVPAVA